VEIAPQPTTHREAPDMATTDQADTRTTDFPWVGAWERMMMASDPDHIEELVALARSEAAPQTATYRRGPGDWSTIDDIVSLDTQRRLGLPTTPEAAVMTTHRKASEALHAVTGALADLRSVEVPASLAIERSDVMHDLDRAARFLAHAQLRATELAAKTRAEVR
jgi:hypothetical protein